MCGSIPFHCTAQLVLLGVHFKVTCNEVEVGGGVPRWHAMRWGGGGGWTAGYQGASGMKEQLDAWGCTYQGFIQAWRRGGGGGGGGWGVDTWMDGWPSVIQYIISHLTTLLPPFVSHATPTPIPYATLLFMCHTHSYQICHAHPSMSEQKLCSALLLLVAPVEYVISGIHLSS